jgi:hypothetical protein
LPGLRFSTATRSGMVNQWSDSAVTAQSCHVFHPSPGPPTCYEHINSRNTDPTGSHALCFSRRKLCPATGYRAYGLRVKGVKDERH